MNIKELLGDKYREDMTVAEVAESLAEIDMVERSAFDGYVPKDTANKLSSEAAEAKRKLRERMTEEEARAAKEAEERTALEVEVGKLRRTATVAEFSKRFVTLGFDEEAANGAAEAFADGNHESVFAAFGKRLSTMEKTLRAELLKTMTVPPAAGGAQDQVPTRDEFMAMTYEQKYEIKHSQPDVYRQLMSQGG